MFALKAPSSEGAFNAGDWGERTTPQSKIYLIFDRGVFLMPVQSS